MNYQKVKATIVQYNQIIDDLKSSIQELEKKKQTELDKLFNSLEVR